MYCSFVYVHRYFIRRDKYQQDVCIELRENSHVNIDTEAHLAAFANCIFFLLILLLSEECKTFQKLIQIQIHIGLDRIRLESVSSRERWSKKIQYFVTEWVCKIIVGNIKYKKRKLQFKSISFSFVIYNMRNSYYCMLRIQVKYCINAFNYACRSMQVKRQYATVRFHIGKIQFTDDRSHHCAESKLRTRRRTLI